MVVIGQQLVFLESFDDVVGLGDGLNQRYFRYRYLLELFLFHLNFVLWVVVLEVLIINLLVLVLGVVDHVWILILVVELSWQILLIVVVIVIVLWFRLLLCQVIITIILRQ